MLYTLLFISQLMKYISIYPALLLFLLHHSSLCFPFASHIDVYSFCSYPPIFLVYFFFANVIFTSPFHSINSSFKLFAFKNICIAYVLHKNDNCVTIILIASENHMIITDEISGIVSRVLQDKTTV